MTRVIVSFLVGALLIVSGGAAAEPKTTEQKSAKEEKRIGLDRRGAEKLLAANGLLAEDKYDAAKHHIQTRGKVALATLGSMTPLTFAKPFARRLC